MRKIKCWILVAAVLAGAFGAKATLLYFDSFTDDPGGKLRYQSGGIGGKGPWYSGYDILNPVLGSESFAVADGALNGNIVTYPRHVALPPTGNRSEIIRPLGIPLGQDGTTRYLRFLFRADNDPFNVPVGRHLGLELQTGRSSGVYVGSSSNRNFTIGRARDLDHVSSTNEVVGQTVYVLVLKMEFRAGNDILTLYVDPPPFTEPASGEVLRTDIDVGQPDTIALVANHAMSVDDIAIADNYYDVMNVESVPVIPYLKFEQSSASFYEGDSGTNLLKFTAYLSEPVDHSVSVDCYTLNNTAKAGSDYLTNFETVYFLPGITSATVTVAVLGDKEIEPDEAFILIFTGLNGTKFINGGASSIIACTILTDDFVEPTSLSITRIPDSISVNWTGPVSGYELQMAMSPFATNWTTAAGVLQVSLSPTNYGYTYSEPIQASGHFFRLRKLP